MIVTKQLLERMRIPKVYDFFAMHDRAARVSLLLLRDGKLKAVVYKITSIQTGECLETAMCTPEKWVENTKEYLNEGALFTAGEEI